MRKDLRRKGVHRLAAARRRQHSVSWLRLFGRCSSLAIPVERTAACLRSERIFVAYS
jgi:hypothetical protein